MQKRINVDHADGYTNSRSRNEVANSREQIRIKKNGVEKELSLIAIPVITSFKEIVPASHFDTAMHGLRAESCVDYLTEVCAPEMHLKLLPQFFLFDQLLSIPASTLKRGCASMHFEVGNLRRQALRWVKYDLGCKRSAVFLRYLVGSQDAGGDACREGLPRICSKLQDVTMRMLERRIGRNCMVEAVYTGSFCEQVYAAMWRYQVGQLDYVTQHVRNSAGRRNCLNAKVTVQGQRHQFVLTVGFFSGDQPITGRNYMLRSRPSEDAIRCLHRVKDRIEAAGICAVVQDHFMPWDDGFGKSNWNGCDILPFAIPI